MPASLNAKVAFVTGANGISGFSIIEHLVRQPKEEWCALPSLNRSSQACIANQEQEQNHHHLQTPPSQRLD
jgi:N-acetyl-gamma-glutamylphosphate reductase